MLFILDWKNEQELHCAVVKVEVALSQGLRSVSYNIPSNVLTSDRTVITDF